MRTLLSLALILAVSAARAEDSATTTLAQNVTDEAPSLELLQFLGEWETREGKWVDPVAFGALTQVSEGTAAARPKEEQDHGRK